EAHAAVVGRLGLKEAGADLKSVRPIPRPPRVLPKLYTDEPVQDGERTVTLRRVGNTQWLSALYHTVPGAHPDAVALEAATDIMAVTPGGRLYKSLVESRKAATVSEYFYVGHDPGFAMFLAQVWIQLDQLSCRQQCR
ncbi:MAG: insulinase family protein, partial [Planctomycetota bacterium]